MKLSDKHTRYWRKNLRITGLLMGVWFVVSFGLVYFARDITFTFFGWPFSFWVAAQGALLVYCLIVWFYARYMNRLDVEYGMTEENTAENRGFTP